MSEDRFTVPEMEHVYEQLQVVAARQAASQKPATRWGRWRRKRRLITTVVAVLLGSGAAATATQLIDTGEPVKPAAEVRKQYRPRSGRATLDVTIADPKLGFAWGVAAYTSQSGEQCVYVGQVRGTELGLIENDRFRPFPPDKTGDCRDLNPDGLETDLQTFATDPPRTLLFGRAGANVESIRLDIGANRIGTAKVGQSGTFLFVLDDRPDGPEIKIVRLDGSGRRLR